MALEYTDGSLSFTPPLREGLADALAADYSTKQSLRNLVVTALGEDAVLELNWTGRSTKTPVNSLIDYCIANRKLSDVVRIAKGTRVNTIVLALLGQGILKVKEADDDGDWQDGPGIACVDDAVKAMIIGALLEFYPTEDILRTFVQDKLKSVQSQVTWDSGILDALTSLVNACIKKRRFGRLLEFTYKNSGQQGAFSSFGMTIMFLVGHGVFVNRSGGTVTL